MGERVVRGHRPARRRGQPEPGSRGADGEGAVGLPGVEPRTATPRSATFSTDTTRNYGTALHVALVAAETQGLLAPGVEPGAAAELLTLLAYGVNLRSRAGADAGSLHATVTAALQSLGERSGVTP